MGLEGHVYLPVCLETADLSVDADLHGVILGYVGRVLGAASNGCIYNAVLQ